MERKIGDIFTYKGKTYEVVQSRETCIGCAFRDIPCKVSNLIKGGCSSYYRSDNISVIFKEIKNMEIKNNQLTIDIPKGMEIDIENSDFTKGVIKFKPKYITYNDIVNSANSMDSISALVQSGDMLKLEAMEQLMSIARYYNKDWKPDWNEGELKYFIVLNHYSNTYGIDYDQNYNSGVVYFKNKKDAQSVIDNPNFREILDIIYK